MKAKVIIIFLVVLIAGAGSGTFKALAEESLNSYGVDIYPETSTFPTTAGTYAAPATLRHDTIWWEFAWQEYNVSPEDTIWFDDFLVVGSDTLLWEEVYGYDYAWQEYNVSPEDTIWFDDFLAVGSDTLLWEEVYGHEYALEEVYGPEYVLGRNNLKLKINLVGSGTFWYDPGLYFGFDNFQRYYDPLHVEFLWRNRNGTMYSFENQYLIPYIAPIADWIEIAVINRAEKERPLYTYYMPQPVMAPDSPAGLVQRRRSGDSERNPLVSAVRALLFPDREE